MDEQVLVGLSAADRHHKNGAKRSRTGCFACRRRKIKCDEQRPSCGQCARSGRQCDSTTTIFRQHESSFTAARPVESRRLSAPAPRTGAGSTTSGNVWVQIPQQVVFVNEQIQEQEPSPEQHATTEALDEPSSLSAGIWSESMITSSIDLPKDARQPVLESYTVLAENALPVGSVKPPKVARLVGAGLQLRQSTASYATTSPKDLTVAAGNRAVQNPHESPVLQRDFAVEHSAIDENREASFFLRHFSETPGKWMDLFDLDGYYSRQVPVLARRNPLVKYAACAFAAKQLGRVYGRKTIRGGVASRLSDMETWPAHDAIDYIWFGVKYYDRSISLLMEQISQGNHAHQDNYNRRYNDETVVAATILCNYEFLSATTAGWSGHLDGTQSLLRLIDEEGLFQFQPSPRLYSAAPNSPNALRATFWNFARQDFLASLILRKHTRLNTDNLDTWRAMGLSLNEDGLVTPSNLSESALLPAGILMRDDMVSNALIWLLSKIVNFIATAPQTSPSGHANDMAADIDLQAAAWQALNHELLVWYEGLPATFQPSGRIQLDHRASSCLQWETWYSNSMCASTMQSYYMARMLLLINRPAKLLLESSLSCPPALTAQRHDLLSACRSMQNELRAHAVEICSIALGRPEDSARIHMLQPLYIAGRCLTDPKDREIVIDLMRDIEQDLGWATEYRIEQLLKEWEDTALQIP